MPVHHIKTPSDIKNLLGNRSHEHRRLEFKSNIDDYKPKKLALILASLANTDGGTLIIGIDENADRAWRLVDVNVAVTRQKIAQALSWLAPNALNPDIRDLTVDGRQIVVVNVKAQITPVAVQERRTDGNVIKLEICTRNDHGVQWHTFSELEAMFSNHIRGKRLLLEQIAEKGKEIEVCSELWTRHRNGALSHEFPNPIRLEELADDHVQLVHQAHHFNVPYGVIREAWKTVRGAVGMILDVALVNDQGRVLLLAPGRVHASTRRR